MRQAILRVCLFFLALAPCALSQDKNGGDIDQLFQGLQQTLVQRSTPERFLSPSLPSTQRQLEVQKALRPYVTLQFKYNLADLQQKGTNQATLPLIVEWETANGSGRLTDTAELEKVNGQWFFRNFEFLVFPWPLAIGGSLFGVTFAATVLYYYFRSRRRRAQNVSA